MIVNDCGGDFADNARSVCTAGITWLQLHSIISTADGWYCTSTNILFRLILLSAKKRQRFSAGYSSNKFGYESHSSTRDIGGVRNGIWPKLLPRTTKVHVARRSLRLEAMHDVIKGFTMPSPYGGGGIKRCFCLTSVCLTSVCRVHRVYLENREA